MTPLVFQLDGIRLKIEEWAKKTPYLRGVFLIGSCSLGEAQATSDIDLIFIIDVKKLEFGIVQKLRNEWEEYFGESLQSPLPIQMNFVQPSVFHSMEPAMRKALDKGILLFPNSSKENFLKNFPKEK